MDVQEQALRSRTDSGRVFVLDALRGIAAFTVILTHFHTAFRGYYTNHWYVRPFITGHESVILFFVLSGYVLSMAAWRGKQLPYGLYLIRRATRIYLPYVMAMLLAAAVGKHFLFSRVQLNEWFRLTWQEPITWRVIVAGLWISPVPTLNTAFWSLQYEMQMSLVFPALCLIIIRLRTAGTVALILVVTVCSIVLSARTSDPFLAAESLRYCTFFVMGALLAKNQIALTKAWKVLGTTAKALIATISIALYLHFFGVFKGQDATRIGLADASTAVSNDLVVALGVFGIIVTATSSGRAQQFLDRPLFEYLGRVSYSLYLLHGTVLFALINLLYGKVPVLVLGLTYLTVAMFVSHLFLIAIEEPSLQWGKRLTSAHRLRNLSQASNSSDRR